MAEIKQSNEQFASRWGLLFTILGMAVGTGSIWRFPREVAANNGGTFIIAMYIATVVWAIPIICAESAFGKKTRFASAGGFKIMGGTGWTWLGGFAAMVCILAGSYYAAVLGWVLKYVYLIATGFLGELGQLSNEAAMQLTQTTWDNFAMNNPTYEACAWFAAAVIIAAIVISRGIQGGIEVANKVLIPAVFILLLILAIRVVFLDGASKGLEYMFTIHPEEFANPRMWLAAFTQAAWGTGAGWTMYHVYYIYSAKDEDVQLNSFTVSFGLTCASILAGIVVLGAVYSLAPDPEAALKAGANGLTFVHLTNLFAHTTGGFFMAVLFFLALVCAALSTLIAMLEVAVRNLMDMGFTRKSATLAGTIFFLVVGSISAIDHRVFENQDMVWGVGVLMVGLLYGIASMKYGLDKIWKEDIDPCSDIHVEWLWKLIRLCPIWFLFVWGWWIYDAATWYPGEWYKFWPITTYMYTPGSMVVEWAILFAIMFALNGFMSKRLVASNSGASDK